MNVVPIRQEGEAEIIGRLYRSSREGLVNAVRERLECGKRLKAEKEKQGHGNWLPWLKANEKTLGFGESTALKLMNAYEANPELTTDLTENAALKISRKMWGNDNPKPREPEQHITTYVSPEIDGEIDDDEPVAPGQLTSRMRIRGLLYRAKEARDGALADDMQGIEVSDELRKAVADAAEAWVQLLSNLNG